jgi:hypothetical protein
MLIDLIKEVILELLRALYLEDLCRRVKRGLRQRVDRRSLRRRQAWLRHLHIRNRDRLLHRLTTGKSEKL